MPRPDNATRDSLLDAAEALFAELGFTRASVRAITDAAGANVAAVNYHFGSKLQLIKAVLERRVGPLNAERLRRLDACESRGQTTLHEVTAAFVEPALEMVRNEVDRTRLARLTGNALSQAGAELRPVMLELFGPVIERFVNALARCLPDADRAQLCWRFHFMIGATNFTVGLGALAEAYSAGACDPSDADAISRELVGFVAAGFRHDALLERP